MDKFKNTMLKAGNFVKTKFSGLSKKTVVGIFGGAAAVLVAIIILSVILNQTRYEVLFNNVSTTEAQEIVTYARENLGITDIKLNSNGDILVDSKVVEDVRIELSMANYPSTGFNYESLDSGTNLFSTDSDKRQAQKENLEKKLSYTLRHIQNVDSALVILNISDNDKYVISSSAEESGASVMLTVRDTLSAKQVDGIYNLVVNSVPKIKRDNITVTDQSGAVLSPDYTLSAAEESAQMLSIVKQRNNYQDKLREDLEAQIERIISRAFEEVNVSVGLQLNFDKMVTEKLTYTGTNIDENGNQAGIVANEILKSAAGGIAEEGGLIGTTVNSDIFPDYPTLSVGEDGEFYQEYQREINYLVNEVRDQIEKDGPTIDSLSASVVVKSNNTFTNEEETRWRNTIANAIGADPGRVSIQAVPFVEETNPNPDNPGGISISNISGESLALLAIIIVLGIILIVLLILALNAPGSRKKRRAANRLAPATAPAAGHGAGELDYNELGERGFQGADDGEFEIASLSDETPETRDEALKREIQDFSKNNPEIVAQLIRNWIRSEE